MSYDLRLCLPEAGRSREEIARSDSLEISPTDAAGGEQRNQRLAAALAAAFPGLARSDVDSAERRDREEASAGVGDLSVLELTASDNATGLQVVLAGREAGITLPYGHGQIRAREALAIMWRCAEIIEREGGFFAYDPQVGRVLDLTKDFELAATTYGRGAEQVARTPGCARGENRRRLFARELDRLHYLLH